MSLTQTATAPVCAENRHFKAYPSKKQEIVLLKMQRAYQLWWNQILEWTLADFEQKSLKTGMSGLVKYSKEIAFYRNTLKRLDRDNPMLSLSIGSLSTILKKQLVSWDRVFDAIKKNKKSGSTQSIGKPRFKARRDCRSESIPFAFDKRLARTALHMHGKKSEAWISVPLLDKTLHGKRLSFARSDTLNGEIGSFTIHRKPSGWMICANVTGITTFAKSWYGHTKVFSSDESFTQGGIGLDAGMRTRLTPSDPQIAPLCKILYSLRDQESLKVLARKRAHKLRYAKKAAGFKPNQPLSKGQRVSQSNRARQIEQRIERIHERNRNQNKDALHKFTTTIVENHSFIAVESLALKPMAQSKNRSFRRSFQRAAMGACIAQFEYKSQRTGRTFIKIGRFFASSKLCSTEGCWYKNTQLKSNDTVWTCPNCNRTHQRDLNAATNIRREGLRLIHKDQAKDLLSKPIAQTAGSAADKDIGCRVNSDDTVLAPILDCSRTGISARIDVKSRSL